MTVMSERYVKGTFDYYGKEVEGYEVYIGKRYLGFVAKFESATRSYWSVIDSYEGCYHNGPRISGQPHEYGPWRSWDQSRGSIVYATFPLELGEDPRWVELRRYSWVA